jgi:UDP-glucose 4-epimerase
LRILITGASGYLGGRISSYLDAQGHEIYAQLRQIPSDNCAWISSMHEVLQGDLTDTKFLSQICHIPFDAVIHTVSFNHHQSENDIDQTLAVNVGITWNLLKILVPTKLNRFIYLSTQQVYGKTGAVKITESCLPAPVNAYGLTHLMSEEVVNQFSRTSETIGLNLRLSNIVGAPAFPSSDCWWLVVHDLCRMALKQKEIRLLSDGTPQRDFLNVNDLFSILHQLLQVSTTNATINLGSGVTYTILEVAQEVARVYQQRSGIKIPVILKDGTTMDSETKVKDPLARLQYQSDILTELPIKPSHSLTDGINEVMDFLGNHEIS